MIKLLIKLQYILKEGYLSLLQQQLHAQLLTNWCLGHKQEAFLY